MASKGTVLVTGGTGYIGSHTCVELIDQGYGVVAVDNLSASTRAPLERICQLTGVDVPFHETDIRDTEALTRILRQYEVDAVMHFAAKKAVSESTEIPLVYFDNNVRGTVSLLQAMQDAGVHRVIFSSSCSVYGNSTVDVLDENAATGPTNPYAWTKLTCEQINEQTGRYLPDFRIVNLRYFNPIGAHPSGLLGEDPFGVPRNVLPYMTRVAAGTLERLQVFGDDYPTPDGTCIRDYIHVIDVARGHLAALDHLDDAIGVATFNLGTGVGTSVLELHEAFERASGCTIPFDIGPRRPGDVPRLVADVTKVQREWGWEAEFNLAAMCADAWNFQVRNALGYQAEQSR